MSLPQFVHHGPVFPAPEKLRYNPHGDLIFPSVVPARQHVPDARGRYYLYYAPHDAPGGLCLAYSEALTGPWTEYEENPFVGRVWAPHYEVSHVSSPHVIWMEQENKFFLYFHGENDTTRLATSADGIHFQYDGVVVHTGMYEGISEASYARVFPVSTPERSGYIMLFMGNNKGTRRIYSAWSQDGRTFTPQLKPLINPPPGTGVNQAGGPWYFPWEGRHLVLFHGDKVDEKLVGWSDIYAAEVGAAFDREEHLGILLGNAAMGPDNRRASDPCLVQDETGLWLFNAAGARLSQWLALARCVS